MLMERKIESQAAWQRLRLFPLAIGALAMVFGLWTGLTRLGVVLPGGTPRIAELHGALMICGFLGTLISLERAVALGRWWGYAAPFLSSLGTVALLAGMPHIGALAFVSAGGFLAVASASALVRQPALRQAGLPRFSAVSILAGHAWLAVAGILILVAPPDATAFSYDAAVHAIAIGFVLSMVLGHGPIILPAVIGARVRYTGLAYVPVALLHASVLLRVGSDMSEWL
jgi:hypothetical protein